jgi:phosphatidate cytidylyltransferase
LLKRVLTTMVGLPVLLASVWWGAPWFTILVAAAAMLAIWEFYRLIPGISQGSQAGRLPLILGASWVLALVLGAQAASGTQNFLIISAGILAAGAFVTLLWFTAFSTGRPRRQEYLTLLYLLAGGVYVGFLLAHGPALRELGLPGGPDLGRDFLLLALLAVFATDSGAYFTGRGIGRHPLAPNISPNKTWEGSAGGLASAVAASLILGLVLDLAAPLWQLGLLGAAIGVIAQTGDLAESKLKRLSSVKDTGSIIPGHGGILDRLDSVVVSIPAVYYFVVMAVKP